MTTIYLVYRATAVASAHLRGEPISAHSKRSLATLAVVHYGARYPKRHYAILPMTLDEEREDNA